jgi:carboxymethylenebutenolidase
MNQMQAETKLMSVLAIPAAGGGRFEAHLALPEGRPAPAIIVVSSIYGVTQGLKNTMARYAERGFITIAPDFFWRTAPGPLEHGINEIAVQRAHGYDINDGIDDMRRTRDVLAARPEWNGKFAVLGFCFGGKHALLGLTRLGADAAAAFHGSGIHLHLDEAQSVTKPFSFHFAGNDPLVPPEQVERIRAALHGKPGEIAVYDDALHGFAREESPRYNAAAAQLSEERSFAWLDSLKGVPAGG